MGTKECSSWVMSDPLHPTYAVAKNSMLFTPLMASACGRLTHLWAPGCLCGYYAQLCVLGCDLKINAGAYIPQLVNSEIRVPVAPPRGLPGTLP